MAKKDKTLEYINDISIIFDNKKATPEEIEAAHKRQELREQKLADTPILRNNVNRKKVVKKNSCHSTETRFAQWSFRLECR